LRASSRKDIGLTSIKTLHSVDG